MLTPEQIQELTTEAAAVTEELNTKLIRLMIKRVCERLNRGDEYLITSVDVWTAQTLRDIGGDLTAVARLVAQYNPKIQAAIFGAFNAAFKASWEQETGIYTAAGITQMQPASFYVEILRRNYEGTLADYMNFTRSIASTWQTEFFNITSRAYMAVASGAMSYTGAYSQAIREMVDTPFKAIVYPSGHVDTIETATVRAIRTAVNQTAADITQRRMQEVGWDIVLVSAHYGARPSHAAWQGKFYSLNGTTPGLKTLAEACGYGEVDGLCGANCRHSFGPHTLDYNPYDDIAINREESAKMYKAEQTQRAYEREIRHDKSALMELETAKAESVNPEAVERIAEDYNRRAYHMAETERKYNEFSEEHALKTQPSRMEVGGFGKEQEKSATRAALAWRKRLQQES